MDVFSASHNVVSGEDSPYSVDCPRCDHWLGLTVRTWRSPNV